MDFIFMLTHQDRTLPNALAVLDEIRPLGLRHIGFKDVGADWQTQRKLRQAIGAIGATCYLEVVSTDARSCLRSAQRARRLGVDCLLGGTDVAATLDILGGSGIAYFPFPGEPRGHPTLLGGGPERIAADCRRMVALGCAGADLLAYRAVDADPIDLVLAARHALKDRRLIVAGSIDSPARIAELAQVGVDSFTIGSSVVENSFASNRQGFIPQLEAVLTAIAATGPGSGSGSGSGQAGSVA